MTDGRSHRYVWLRSELADLITGSVSGGRLSPSDADTASYNRSRLGPGALLPSEAALAATFGVSRVTVRRALGLLKTDGLVDSRQGFGWVVAGPPMRQPLTVLAPIDEQIATAGRRPGRRLLAFAVGPAPDGVAAVLGVASVLQIARLNLADGEPVGRNTAWVPEGLAEGIALSAVERESLHRLLPVALVSATQTVTAEAACPDDARLLGVPAGSPLLSLRRTTYDGTGRAALYSEAVYNPLRAEFVVDMRAPGSSASS